MVFDSHNRFIQNRPAANPTNGIWNKDVYKYPNKFVILSAMWRSKMEKTKNRAGKKERFEHIYKEYSKPMYLYALSFSVRRIFAEKKSPSCGTVFARQTTEIVLNVR